MDPRIAAACKLIREDPAAAVSTPELAAHAALSDNLTAAASAGFASPSHLSDRFKSTFGLTATQLLGTGVTVRTYAV